MHSLTLVTMLLVACGHEELNFELPDGGGTHNLGGARSAISTDYAGSASSFRGVLDPTEVGRDLPESNTRPASAGSGSAASAGRGSMSTPVQNAEQAQRYQIDPRGYPTGPGQLAAACLNGQSFDEVCGNDIDEDCDGTVDEFPGIGAPCRSGCGEGVYVCSTWTNALLCRGAQGCMNPVPAPCGDGLLGSDEQCDPNAPSEQAGITCTLTCERPLFIRCVDSGIAHPELCDELHVCNERIGACVPVIGPGQRRCPQLRIEGSPAEDQFYPMLETENGECWITCREGAQCPSSLSECYMGFCAVPF